MSAQSDSSDLGDFLKDRKPKSKGALGSRSVYTSMTKARDKKKPSSQRPRRTSYSNKNELSTAREEDEFPSVKDELMDFLSALPKSPKSKNEVIGKG